MTETTIRRMAVAATSLIDAAAACGREGADFTLAECAPVLFEAYPGTSAVDLADVLAAVWPDQADVDTLTAALTACKHDDGGPAYPPEEVGPAAHYAAHTAHDLYVRDGLLDAGQVPYSLGEPYQSPDIVPNPADPTQLATRWRYDLGMPIVTGATANTIYVRAMNAYPGPRTGQVFLYYAPASLLMTPSIWARNRIPNQNGTDAATLTSPATGVAAVGDAPFVWQTDGPPAGDHFCLVAQVVTEFQPDTIPGDDTLDAFVRWVRDHPGIGWRNVTTVALEAGTKKDLVVSFHNPEAEALDFLLTVECANLPLGTTVRVTCSATGPSPPIDSTQTIAQTPKETLFVAANLPAGFAALLVISVTPPAGSTLPPEMVVTARYLLQDPANPALAAKTVPAVDVGAQSPGRLLYLGDYVYVLKPG